jgi:hypothetical protein
LGKGAYRNCKHNGRRRERTVASGQESGVRISDLGEGPKLAEVTEREFSPQRHRVHEVRKEEGMVFLFWDVDLLLNGKAMAVRWRAAVPWSLDISYDRGAVKQNSPGALALGEVTSSDAP